MVLLNNPLCIPAELISMGAYGLLRRKFIYYGEQCSHGLTMLAIRFHRCPIIFLGLMGNHRYSLGHSERVFLCP